MRKLIWPLWLTHIFTQWGWLILFIPDHFSRQHQIGESPPNYLFLRIFPTGQTYLLSTPFIAAASQHHERSHLIYGPLESTLLDQGFPVEYELDAFNPPHRNTFILPLTLAMSTATHNFAQTSSYIIPGQHFQETFMLLSYNNQDHTYVGDYIIPVLNQQTRPLLHLWRPYLRHSTMPYRLWRTFHSSILLLKFLLNSITISYLPFFLWDLQQRGTLYSHCH